MTRPPFPSVIDSSMMSSFRSCPRRFELEYLHHYKPVTPSVHLHAGGAYARGLEVARKAFYEEGKDPQTALAAGLKALLEFYGDFECPADSAKSLERMLGAFEFTFDQYPLGEDAATPIHLPSGGRGIEFSFAEPLDILHPVTGDPLIYCGRFDMLVDYAGGQFGEDDKTTSSLGPSWARQWDLRSQLTAYTWGAQQAGIHIQGFLVRGISILKTKYDTQQALTYRPAWMVERWYEQTLLDIKRIIQMWEAGKFDYNLDESCNQYGGCIFKQPCLSLDPSPWLENNFIRRKWNPLTRVEEEVGGEGA